MKIRDRPDVNALILKLKFFLAEITKVIRQLADKSQIKSWNYFSFVPIAIGMLFLVYPCYDIIFPSRNSSVF